jgi:hypothetical protein
MSEMMHEGEMALRRMLRAAADQVEPADGLDRIRERVRHRRPRPLLIAWAQVAGTRLSLRVPDGFWGAGRKAARELQAACERILPAGWRTGSDRIGRLRLSWLRPTLAMGTAVFIVAAVVYMAIKVPQSATTAGNGSQSSIVGGASKHPGSNTAPGQSETQGGRPTPSGGQNSGTNGRNSSTCGSSKAAPPIISQSPTSPMPSISPASPTPTVTPTVTPTPTPTPTDGESTSPADSGSSPSDGESAPSSGDQGASAGRVLASTLSKTTHKPSGINKSAHPSPTPCPSPTRKRGSGGGESVSPDAIGTLTVWAGLIPTEATGRIY